MRTKKRSMKKVICFMSIMGMVIMFVTAGKVSAAEELDISAENFPSVSVQDSIAKWYDWNGNYSLSAEELAAVDELWIQVSEEELNKPIDISGLELLPNLESITMEDMELANPEIFKKMPGLKGLELNNVGLKSIDISANVNLVSLSLNDNQLKQLDLSVQKNTLKWLECEGNEIDYLNLNGFSKLQKVNCSYNKLKQLDVRQTSKLTYLNCKYNKLKKLNVSKSTKLENLECNNNRIIKLDVRKNTKLFSLDCYDNNLTTLNISKCNKLQWLYAQNNGIKKIDTRNSPQLRVLQCANNKIKKLNLKNNKKLSRLECNNNKIKTLDIRNNKKLKKKLFVYDKNVKVIRK